MKIAILSDIHGNFEALQAVCADMDAESVNRTICLGDCIGYGPQPEEVLQWVQARNIPTLLGNHELAVRDQDHMNWFNPKARRSLEITLALLSPASLTLIRNLPTHLIVEGGYCVHGFPPDSVRTYLFQKTEFELLAEFNRMQERICFVGHTHDLEIIRFNGKRVDRRPLPVGPTRLDDNHQYLINIGSVGQPRDGTNKAKYLIWRTLENIVEIRAVTYNIQKVADQIKAVGLPEGNANRLW